MSVADRLARVREQILEAESRAGRKPGSVRLMAISKFHPAEAVLEAMSSGQTLFGENRVQEACTKFIPLLERYPSAELHLVGTLQSNKIRQIVPVVSCIQSIDRAEIIPIIDRQAGTAGKRIKLLFEFHTGEESKAGFADADSVFRAIDSMAGLANVSLTGFMTMAPFTDDEAEVRSSFRKLVALRDECAKRYPGLDLSTLSMGMSSDFRLAIEEGSTLVRIGTAIFGERPA